jgi:magnesium and cobalt transporter
MQNNIIEEEPEGQLNSQTNSDTNNEKKTEPKQSFLSTISALFAKNKPAQSLRETVEEIIDEIEESQEEGEHTVISSNERSIIKNVIEFSELYVEDILIPRADIFAISQDIDFEKLQTKLIKKTHTRIPVYKRNLDDIVGFIHVKDIVKTLFQKQEFKIEDALRQCLFVPPSMKISNLLIKMQVTRVHMAIVVDEYGGTMGLVTLEDLLEEIVGTIEDEHDIDKSFLFKRVTENVFEVSSRISIEEFEKKTELKLFDENSATAEAYAEQSFDTLGGLISSIVGRLPVVGEIVTLNESTEFEITDADARSIKRVIVRRK